MIASDFQLSFAAGNLSFGFNEFLALISAACLAFSHAMRKWQHASINNWESAFLMFLVSVPILVLVSILIGEPALNWQNVTEPEALFAMTMSGLLNAIGLVVINYALGHIDIVLSNNILRFSPFLVFWSAFFTIKK